MIHDQPGYYYQQNKPDDKDFEDELRKNYSHNINSSQAKRADMVKFMDALKRGEPDQRLDEVLQAGKGGMKRHYPVDEKLYGTEEGIATKKRIEEELKNKQPKKKKRKKKAGGESKKKAKSDESKPSAEEGMSTTKKSAVAAAVVGTAAVAIGLLFGGGRSQWQEWRNGTIESYF